MRLKILPSQPLYGVLGQFPLSINIQNRALNFWIQLCKNEQVNLALNVVTDSSWTLNRPEQHWQIQATVHIQIANAYPNLHLKIITDLPWEWAHSSICHKVLYVTASHRNMRDKSSLNRTLASDYQAQTVVLFFSYI